MDFNNDYPEKKQTVVYDYCYDCYREYQNEYNRRRQEGRRLA